jgi:hypothetical protein
MIFTAALILVCGLSAFIGMPAPLQDSGHDTFFLLDNAYRVIQGQVPHRDFSSAWGPVIYLIDAGGLVLSGMQPAGIGYANALFGSLIAIWAFSIVRTKWSSASACAAGIYTILLITAPFPLGIEPSNFGFAMIYNRYGYALFGIMVMECAGNVFAESVDALPTHSWMRQSTIGAISTGFALGLLAFLKISYAIVAVSFVAFSTILVDTSRRRRLFELCSGFMTLAVLVLWYLRFDLSDMLQDLAIAAAGRRLSLQPLHSIGTVDLIQAFALLTLAGLRDTVKAQVTHNPVQRFRGTLLALMTLAAGYLILVSNQQSDTFPLNGYAAVALAADYGRLTTGSPLKWRGLAPRLLRALLLAVCLLPLCMENGLSLALAARERQWPKTPNVVSLASTERGAYLLFRPTTRREIMGVRYVEAVNDGLELIGRHSGPPDGVLTFDEFNPFNYLLDRPSPRGGFAAAAYNYLFSDAAHPTAERFLGDAPYVMVRKYRKDGPDVVERDDVLALMRIYGQALQAQFDVVEETEHWVLWRRKLP